VKPALGAVISSVLPGGKAERAGLQQGDCILSINGDQPRDLIELSFALAEERIELEVAKLSGARVFVRINKKLDESLGFEFESAVFDRVRTCANKCLFCFVDQMPQGLRDSLYVKDDDYRLSFLYGNFVTLTNLTETDFDRIRRFHLSPLYVSVHATDGVLRERLLGTPRAAEIMDQLRRFADAGIEMHTQVVLCPDYNDGESLKRTIRELAELRPDILSLAIVPVGLTRFRTTCHPLRGFSPSEAAVVVDEVSRWQNIFRAETGNSFVYLSDEFYLNAGRTLPDDQSYDGYPQLENGIGLVRSFISDWESAGGCEAFVSNRQAGGVQSVVVSGTAFAPILREMLEPLQANVQVESVTNRFFGPAVNVSGLLTGSDIAAHFESRKLALERIILPSTALRKNEQIFLDGMTVDELQQKLAAPIHVVDGASALQKQLGGRLE
jgi:putative radical SAM enzyme (TIGR03279 family)